MLWDQTRSDIKRSVARAERRSPARGFLQRKIEAGPGVASYLRTSPPCLDLALPLTPTLQVFPGTGLGAWTPGPPGVIEGG